MPIIRPGQHRRERCPRRSLRSRAGAILPAACASLLLASPLSARAESGATPQYAYEVRYDVTLLPDEDAADVVITLGEGAHWVAWLRFNTKPDRHSGFAGDGEVARDGNYVLWTPPEDGGRIAYRVRISHRRGESYDARMTPDWALFRGDDLVPPARIRKEEYADSDATLRVTLPQGWSITAPYPKNDAGDYVIEHADRGFDRPTGWMLAGRLGVRRERIERVRVAVAAPVGQGVRRMDILAFLNWNLPRLRAIVPEMPRRILLVSARDEMWRGGLSGPNSLYLHADRPLISENGTSTLLHELVHVFTGLRGGEGGDWVVEGLAEYYSLKLMWRSGTLSEDRYKTAFRKLEKWAEEVADDRLDVKRSSGPLTARAVLIMRALDKEIYRVSGREVSLDDVVVRMVEQGDKVDSAGFAAAVESTMGRPSETLAAVAGDIGLD